MTLFRTLWTKTKNHTVGLLDRILLNQIPDNPTGLIFFAMFILALCYATGRYWYYHWWAKWALVLFAMWWMYCVWLYEKTHWFLSCTIMYFVVSAGIVFAWRDNIYEHWKLVDLLALKSAAAYAAVKILLISVFFISLSDKHIESFRKTLVFAWRLTVIVTLCFITWEPNFRGSFNGNPSMNGCFIAFMLPLVLLDKKTLRTMHPASWFLWNILAVIAVFITEESLPMGVLGVVYAVFVLRVFWGLSAFTVTSLSGIALLFIGWKYMGPAFFDSSGRFELYEAIMRQWWVYADHVAGTGTGTGVVLISFYQHMAGKGASWLWMHSDYLQVLFEQGYVGMFLVLGLTVVTIKAAWHRPALLAGLAGLIVTAMFNYPARLPLTAVAGSYMVFIAHRKETA